MADRGVSFAYNWKSSTFFHTHYITFLLYFLVYKKHPGLATWVFFCEPNVNYFHTFFACPHYIIITKKLKPHGWQTVGFLLFAIRKSSNLFQIHYITFLVYFLVYKKHPSLATWVFFLVSFMESPLLFFACLYYSIVK